jgi:hypothetical protein
VHGASLIVDIGFRVSSASLPSLTIVTAKDHVSESKVCTRASTLKCLKPKTPHPQD